MLLEHYLVLVALSLAATSAFKIDFYSGKQCTGRFSGSLVVGPSGGCRKDFAGTAAAGLVSSTGEIDDTLSVWFYDSPDCDPNKVINMTVGEGCMAANYKSFEVVNACDIDKYDCI